MYYKGNNYFPRIWILANEKLVHVSMLADDSQAEEFLVSRRELDLFSPDSTGGECERGRRRRGEPAHGKFRFIITYTKGEKKLFKLNVKQGSLRERETRSIRCGRAKVRVSLGGEYAVQGDKEGLGAAAAALRHIRWTRRWSGRSGCEHWSSGVHATASPFIPRQNNTCSYILGYISGTKGEAEGDKVVVVNG